MFHKIELLSIPLDSEIEAAQKYILKVIDWPKRSIAIGGSYVVRVDRQYSYSARKVDYDREGWTY